VLVLLLLLLAMKGVLLHVRLTAVCLHAIHLLQLLQLVHVQAVA
jgi:hypothetical protein